MKKIEDKSNIPVIPKIPDQLDVDTSTVSNECHRNVCPGTSESIQDNVVHDQSEVSRINAANEYYCDSVTVYKTRSVCNVYI